MPTSIDLGKIKVVWRGAFSAGTAYTVDDAVSYDGSSYICTEANSDVTTPNNNSGKWDLMAAGAAPLTAAGQLLSHDGTASEVIDPLNASVGEALLKGSDGTLEFGPVQGTYAGMRPSRPVGFYHNDGVWGKWQDFGTNFYERGWLHIPEHVSNGIIGDGAYAQGDNVPYRELSFPFPKPTPNYIGPDFMTANVHKGHYSPAMGVILEDKTLVFAGEHSYIPTDSDNDFNKWMEPNYMGIPGDKMGMFPDGDYPVQIVAGCGCWYLLMKSGDVWSCGYNGLGQLGHNDTQNRQNFQKIKHIGSEFTVSGLSTHVVAIACTNGSNPSDNYQSNSAVYFLDVHGRLFGCGYNGDGRLATGDTSNRSIPTLISGVSKVDRFGVSGSHSQVFCYAVTTDDELYTWGSNNHGQLGLGDTNDRQTPVMVAATGVRKIYPACYGYHNGSNDYRRQMGWYINNSGEMYGTGYNGNGYLGVGDSTNRTSFTRVGSALFHTMSWSNTEYRYPRRAAIERTTSLSSREVDNVEGQLYTWGYNGYGGLMTGDTNNKNAPFLVTETSSQMVYDQKGNNSKQYTFDPTDIQYVWFESAQGGSDCFIFMLQDADLAAGKRIHWMADYGPEAGRSYGWYYHEASQWRDGYDITSTEVDGPILCQAPWTWEDDSRYATRLEMWYLVDYSSGMSHYYLTSNDYVYGCGYNAYGEFGGYGTEQYYRNPRRLFLAANN